VNFTAALLVDRAAGLRICLRVGVHFSPVAWAFDFPAAFSRGSMRQIPASSSSIIDLMHPQAHPDGCISAD